MNTDRNKDYIYFNKMATMIVAMGKFVGKKVDLLNLKQQLQYCKSVSSFVITCKTVGLKLILSGQLSRSSMFKINPRRGSLVLLNRESDTEFLYLFNPSFMPRIATFIYLNIWYLVVFTKQLIRYIFISYLRVTNGNFYSRWYLWLVLPILLINSFIRGICKILIFLLGKDNSAFSIARYIDANPKDIKTIQGMRCYEQSGDRLVRIRNNARYIYENFSGEYISHPKSSKGLKIVAILLILGLGFLSQQRIHISADGLNAQIVDNPEISIKMPTTGILKSVEFEQDQQIGEAELIAKLGIVSDMKAYDDYLKRLFVLIAKRDRLVGQGENKKPIFAQSNNDFERGVIDSETDSYGQYITQKRITIQKAKSRVAALKLKDAKMKKSMKAMELRLEGIVNQGNESVEDNKENRAKLNKSTLDLSGVMGGLETLEVSRKQNKRDLKRATIRYAKILRILKAENDKKLAIVVAQLKALKEGAKDSFVSTDVIEIRSPLSGIITLSSPTQRLYRKGDNFVEILPQTNGIFIFADILASEAKTLANNAEVSVTHNDEVSVGRIKYISEIFTDEDSEEELRKVLIDINSLGDSPQDFVVKIYIKSTTVISYLLDSDSEVSLSFVIDDLYQQFKTRFSR